MDTQNITFKLFAADGASAAPHDVVRAFHRWIQERALDELLIDVADYAHVHRGPGVLLVAHEAHYGFEHGSDGRLGLKYARKRGAAGTLGERIAVALRKVVRAARLLETDPALALRFRSDELRFSHRGSPPRAQRRRHAGHRHRGVGAGAGCGVRGGAGAHPSPRRPGAVRGGGATPRCSRAGRRGQAAGLTPRVLPRGLFFACARVGVWVLAHGSTSWPERAD